MEGTPIVFTGEVYGLAHPYAGCADQDPDEWWSCLVKATRRALEESDIAPEEIVGLSVDATTSTGRGDRLLGLVRGERRADLVYRLTGRPGEEGKSEEAVTATA